MLPGVSAFRPSKSVQGGNAVTGRSPGYTSTLSCPLRWFSEGKSAHTDEQDLPWGSVLTIKWILFITHTPPKVNKNQRADSDHPDGPKNSLNQERVDINK